MPLPERMRDLVRYGPSHDDPLTAEQVPDPETMHHMRYFTAFSEDGIEWTDVPENPIWVGRSDSTNSVVYNPDRDVFMMYRWSTDPRLRDRQPAPANASKSAKLELSGLIHEFGGVLQTEDRKGHGG